MADSQTQVSSDTLPDDGPWSKTWQSLSKSAGNVVDEIKDTATNATNSVINALPWERDASDLASQTKNVRPPIDVESFKTAQQQPSISFTSLFQRLVGTESGGQHTDASGGLLTSPKGAKGITQIMPKTGSDPGFGVTPLQDNSPQEYLRFGHDYLTAMIKNFGGDTTKAVAAYNAGPAAVTRAVAKAQKTGGDWTSFVPVETQKYIKKIIGT